MYEDVVINFNVQPMEIELCKLLAAINLHPISHVKINTGAHNSMYCAFGNWIFMWNINAWPVINPVKQTDVLHNNTFERDPEILQGGILFVSLLYQDIISMLFTDFSI